MAKAEWFAGRLRELREGAGLTRQDLADRSGLAVNGIRDLEQGRRKPTWESVLALCQALAVEPTAFMTPPANRAPSRGRPRKFASGGRVLSPTSVKDKPPVVAKPVGSRSRDDLTSGHVHLLPCDVDLEDGEGQLPTSASVLIAAR
jgi:DNA-binding XRE family transcriptional regulator